MQEKKSFEFHVGATLFSVIGALFILIALVLLGVNYLSKFALQMSLYGVGLVVIIISELILCKLNENLGNIISSIGLGVLFVPTLVNGTLKDVFGGLLAIIIASVIGVCGIYFGYLRNSIFIRIINIIGVFSVVCVNMHSDSEFKLLVVAVMLLVLGFLNVFWANKSYIQIFTSVHMVLTVAVSMIMNHSGISNRLGPLYIIFSQLALFIVASISALFSEKRNDIFSMWFSVAGASIVEVIMCIDCNMFFKWSDNLTLFTVNKVICLVLIIAVCSLIYVLTDHNHILSKIQVYMAFAALLGLVGVCKYIIEFIIVIIALIGLRFLGRNKIFSHLDSGYYLLCGLLILGSDLSDKWYVSLITLIAYIIGIFVFKYDYIFNEIVSLFMIGIYTAHSYNVLSDCHIDFLNNIKLSSGLIFLVVGVVMVYFVAFSSHKDKLQIPVTIAVFVFQGLLFLSLISANLMALQG